MIPNEKLLIIVVSWSETLQYSLINFEFYQWVVNLPESLGLTQLVIEMS